MKGAKYFINRLVDICDKQIETFEEKKGHYYNQYSRLMANENGFKDKNPYLYQAMEFLDKKINQENNNDNSKE